MNMVFLVTVGLIALWSADDQWHAPALTAFKLIMSQRQVVVTSSFVLLECANASSRRPFRIDLLNMRDELQAAGAIIDPSSEDVESA